MGWPSVWCFFVAGEEWDLTAMLAMCVTPISNRITFLSCGQVTTSSSPKLALASLIPRLRDNRLKSRRRQLTSRHLAAASLVLSDVSKATPSLYVTAPDFKIKITYRSHCSVHIQTLWWKSSCPTLFPDTGWLGSPNCTVLSDNYNLLHVTAHERLMYLQ